MAVNSSTCVLILYNNEKSSFVVELFICAVYTNIGVCFIVLNRTRPDIPCVMCSVVKCVYTKLHYTTHVARLKKHKIKLLRHVSCMLYIDHTDLHWEHIPL